MKHVKHGAGARYLRSAQCVVCDYYYYGCVHRDLKLKLLNMELIIFPLEPILDFLFQWMYS